MSQDSSSPQEIHKFLESPSLRLIKWLLSIFLFASISIIFFTAFFHQSLFRCPMCLSTTNSDSSSTTSYHNYSDIEDEDISISPTPSPSAAGATTNLSHIVFGIGGSINTWKDRKHFSQLWWKPNQTRGYVWLDHKPNPQDSLTWGWPPFKISQDTSKFKSSLTRATPIRISRIAVESFRLGLDNVRWFVMGDDDTVFFPENLVTVLSRYDHNEMYYIGGNSESVEQDVMHSYGMAFGGGGYAVSYPLAVQLNRMMDGCIDRYTDFYGSDERVAACLNEIGIPLTKNQGFHQNDIRGNLYGLLSAHPLTPLISLHHLGAVDPIFPNRTQLDGLRLLFDAYAVDPGRTLQQSVCHDLERKWSFSVSWGYTVQIYPTLLRPKVLQTALLTFKTWRSWSDAPFTFNTRPMSSDPCERPVTYFLDRVDELGNGQTLTSYQRFVDESGMKCNRGTVSVHRVTVSATRMKPDEWYKAPRRPCCEIVNRKDGSESVVHVRTRKCKRGESVSIPS